MENYFDTAWAICRMKSTVLAMFGRDSRTTNDFFFACDTMSMDRLVAYFYQLTGVAA